MLDLLDLEPDYQMDGKSVYALAPDERREARFGFDPDKRMNGPNIIEVQIEDPVDLAHSRLTVLGPATDPATWRGQVDSAVIPDRPDDSLRNERR